jgi:predicted permease
MRDWRACVRRLVSRAKLDSVTEAEVVEELVQHLEDRYNDLLASGLPEQDAEQAVLAELRDAEQFRDALRARRQSTTGVALGHQPEPKRRWSMFANIGHDLAIAIRMIRSKPGYSAMVIAMLALGIASNAAIFSIFNTLFLKPLPFADSDRLVDVDLTAPRWNLTYTGNNPFDFLEWRKSSSTFEVLAGYEGSGYNFSDAKGSQRVSGANVTSGFLDALKLSPLAGRAFTRQDEAPNAPNVVMLGYGMWQRLYQGDPTAVGRVVKLDGDAFTIVGVLPKEAVFPPDAELWTPLRLDPKETQHWFFNGLGRLKPGIGAEQAQADLTRIHKGLIESVKRDVNHVTSPVVAPLRDRYLGSIRSTGHLLLGAVGVLLLIACVNIAGLTLVRGAARSREIAIRFALGAQRMAVIRQLILECLALAALGGLCGVLLGSLTAKGLLALVGDRIPTWLSFQMDMRFALFSVLLTAGAAVAFGVTPALQATAIDTRTWLQDGARSSWSRGRQRLMGALIVGEVALALTLLAGCGLLLQAFRNVFSVDPGFRTENVLAFRLWLPDSRYPKPENRHALFDNLLDRVRALPGVTSAGAASRLPPNEHAGRSVEVEGGWKPGPNELNPIVLEVAVTPGYLETMGVQLLSGRLISTADGQNHGARVAIINESFQRRFWPNADPIGKTLRYGATGKDYIPVIGVTRDMKHYGLEGEMRPSVIVPFRQVGNSSMAMVVRSAREPRTLVPAIRQTLRQVDAELPMGPVLTMGERMDQTLWSRRALSWLFTVFTVCALLLAAAGIYGVTSYAVTQRTRDIGIRLALGAPPSRVTADVVIRSLTLVGTGSLIGVTATWFLAKVLLTQSTLFGVNPRDPRIYLAAIGVVFAIGALAGLLPGRRAASVDPVQTLRAE